MGEGDRPGDLERAIRAYPALAGARVEPLAGGLLHRSYAVSAASGEYIAQRVNPIFSPAIHENIDLVGRHLAERDIQTVRLLETEAGALFVDVPEGGRWRVMERIPGVTFETCGEPAQAAAGGRLVGAFHSGLADFRSPLAPLGFAFHDTTAYLDALVRAIEAHAAHPRAADVRGLADHIFEAMDRHRPPHSLPLRVIHADLKFSNVLFAGSGPDRRADAVALIDLDTVCRLPLYFDMGDALRSWCNRRPEDDAEAVLDVSLYEAAVTGYREALGMRLSGDEQASLEHGLELVALELCARFATDTLAESYFAWDPGRFASSSDHNWERARGQWSLYEQARATADERLRCWR